MSFFLNTSVLQNVKTFSTGKNILAKDVWQVLSSVASLKVYKA